MAMKRVLGFLLVLLGWAGVAPAQDLNPEGRWALMADHRPIAIVELRRDAAAPGGWGGAWLRPDRMTITQTHIVFDVVGPTATRRLLSAVEREGTLELTIEGRSAAAPGRYRFRLLGPDHAELAWIDPLPIPPIPLVRVGAGASVAIEWESGGSFPITTPRTTNEEMTALFRADQAARSGSAIDWSIVAREDAVRRARTRALLEAGELRSGTDFFHAAFIFQHGDGPEDYLLAHTLAVVAAARGRSDAAWIAAATLDRYLMGIGRPQVYGTQFSNRGSWTQDPYDRTLVSDALRAALGVPAQAQQAEQLRQMEERRRAQASESRR